MMPRLEHLWWSGGCQTNEGGGRDYAIETLRLLAESQHI